MATRVEIYARVSTDDKGQDPENQLRQLRAWCGSMGYPIVREYVEHENGGKGVEYRKALAQVFAGAARREFDLLLVWSLDRFSREGMAATVGHLQRLSSQGVSFRSFTEEHLSTENELVRNILLATLASLAKLEREKISQRTKAGLERARAKGTPLGRPKLSDDDREKLRKALDTGESWHAVSVATKIPYSTVKKHARALGYEPRRRVSTSTAGTQQKAPVVAVDHDEPEEVMVEQRFQAKPASMLNSYGRVLPSLTEVLAQLRASRNNGLKI